MLPGGRRISQTVSLVDAVAAVIEAAGAHPVAALDGESVLPLAFGDSALAKSWKDEAFSEYLAHGVVRPVAMLRRGRYKLIYSLDDPPLLFDLQHDPGEKHDLGADPAYTAIREDLRARLLRRWDPVRLEQEVRQGQKERMLLTSVRRGAH